MLADFLYYLNITRLECKRAKAGEEWAKFKEFEYHQIGM